jgi:hypothetical protein
MKFSWKGSYFGSPRNIQSNVVTILKEISEKVRDIQSNVIVLKGLLGNDFRQCFHA